MWLAVVTVWALSAAAGCVLLDPAMQLERCLSGGIGELLGP